MKTVLFSLLLVMILVIFPGTGAWRRRRRRRSPPPPPVTCPSIGTSSHRFVSCSSSYNANSVCTFSCSTGYYIIGSSTTTCGTNSVWSLSFPTCRIRTCSSLSAPTHGPISCSNSNNYGSTCTFSCSNGFALSGSSSRACNGYTWSGSTTSCTDNQPPSFTSCPSNIREPNEDRLTTAVVTYQTPTATDNLGTPSVSKISGSSSGTRFSSGSHGISYRATDGAGNSAECTFSINVYVVSCAPVSSHTGRTHSCPHGVLKGASCSFSCTTGYHLSGESSITCDSHGQWNKEYPNCAQVTCSFLSAPSHGSHASCSVAYGSTCTFTCDAGYNLVGSASRRCSHNTGQTSGFWTESQPRCQKRLRLRRSGVQTSVRVNLPFVTCNSSQEERDIQDELTSQLYSMTHNISCLRRETCEVTEVSIVNCGPNSRFVKAKVEHVPSTHPFVIIILSDSYTSHTYKEGSEDEIAQSLEDSVISIKQLINSKQLDFRLRGELISMGNSTVHIDGWDICPLGTVESHSEGYCVPCSPGSYRMYDVKLQDFECEMCPLNSYQEKEAADICIPCPPGQETMQLGSTSKSDCVGSVDSEYYDFYLPYGKAEALPLSWSNVTIIGLGVLFIAVALLTIHSIKSRKQLSKVYM